MITVPRKYWSLHTHSRFSKDDALPSIEAIVERANELEYPALGLTDHGAAGGWVALYTECRKVGIEPLPGIELYVSPDMEYVRRKTNHLTMVAYNEVGYRNLSHIATLSAKNFYYKPIVDFANFAAMAADGATQGLAISTGCYFGILPQVLMRRGHKEAVQVANTLAGWFPRVYVELQNHGIDEHHSDLDFTDDELIAGIYDVANAAGLPMVVTRDSHYVNEGDRKHHEALKTLVAFSEDPDEAIFPGGGYFMTDEAGLREFFEPKYLSAGLEGLSDLANAACLRLPELETFSLKIPDVYPGQDPQQLLEKKVTDALELSPHKGKTTYFDQVLAELEVIKKQEMAPYLLLVDMVCQFMRDKNISYHTRGSASGCMCNYLLGITQLDPIAFGLRFDRFLSSNRLKPPDVDLDIEHDRRDEVVMFLLKHWAVRNIGSHRKYKMVEDDDEEHGTGSLRVKYFSTMKKKGTPVRNWRDIARKDRDELVKLASMGLIAGYGTHAAGYIVAPNEELVSQLPMTWMASSKKLVTALGKKDVEKLGFLKLDLLGLRTRTAIRVVEGLTGVKFESIPVNDRETYLAISAGKNAGVFQLEGRAMNYGCQQIKPRKIEDVIAAQALFRPATMGSSATQNYKDRRNRIEEVPKRHPDIMDSTRETFGVMLYQEQVMDVCSKMGMVPSELEEMLDAVKASNEYSAGAAVVIEAKMPRIRALAAERGWNDTDLAWFIDSLASYADYSFPKAHAAAYGVVSYRTAYMKRHYPVQFWTGMLVAYGNHDKEKLYLQAARRDNVAILGPEINASGAGYRMEGNAIRKGFLSIKGLGKASSEELERKAPYTSLEDLGKRVIPGKVSGAKMLALGKPPSECGGIIGALAQARALDHLRSETREREELNLEAPDEYPSAPWASTGTD